MVPRSRPDDLRLPAVPRFRGHAGAAARRTFARAERKFDLMQELGTRPAADLHQRLAGLARRHRPRRRGFPRARASAPRKRGLRVGFEALAWGRHVNDYRDAWEVVRRADHPAIGADPRQVPHAGAQDRRRAIARRSRRHASSWCSSPTRRGSTWTSSPGAGISATCRGRATCRSADFMERGARHRL